MINDLPIISPTSRFSNRVENYVKYRPGYPAAIIPFLISTLGLQKDSRIADIGSGTGLFAEPLLEQGYKVICIEPNDEMRKAGEERLSKFPGFVSRRHKAEATGLRTHSIDIITVAQAFHWLEPMATKKEFRRIITPGGQAVLAWNMRVNNSSFMKQFAALKEQYSIDHTVPERIDMDKINYFFAPGEFKKISFPNEQLLNFDALKGQLLSSSYIPLPGHTSYETMISALVQLFVNSNENGFVKMEFETILFYGTPGESNEETDRIAKEHGWDNA